MMKLHDTYTDKTEEFKPIEDNKSSKKAIGIPLFNFKIYVVAPNLSVKITFTFHS